MTPVGELLERITLISWNECFTGNDMKPEKLFGRSVFSEIFLRLGLVPANAETAALGSTNCTARLSAPVHQSIIYPSTGKPSFAEGGN